MKNISTWKPPSSAEIETRSIKELMTRMGMTKKEIREVKNNYGVSASKLLELMQMSKYQFVYPRKTDGQCEPCLSIGKANPKKVRA